MNDNFLWYILGLVVVETVGMILINKKGGKKDGK